MMRNRIFFWTVLFAVSGAWAAPITADQAAKAASTWAGLGTAMGVRLKTAVSSVKSYSVTNDYAFYAVRLEDSGTVFLSSDTQMDPVIAFTAGAGADLSEGSPLRVLLDGDIAYRAAVLGASTVRTTLSSATGATAQYESLWAKLLGSQRATTAAADPQTFVDDVRVAPIVETRWSQQQDNFGRNCYNYYTPYNYACGCTATALSQVMRYFKFPTAAIAPKTCACTCGLTPATATATNLTTLAGIYEWDKMTAVPVKMTPEENLQAIGKLTYDTGVLLQSEYTKSDGTGAVGYDTPKILRDYYGYSNAFFFWNSSNWNKQSGGLHSLSIREKVIYASLDAKIPVLMAIYGYQRGHDNDNDYWGGHAVVADGYGYKTIDEESVAFVHVNLGWAGSDDLWYNIPSIHTGTGTIIGGPAYDFDYLSGALFNVMTEGTGEILSGRVVNADDEPIAGAQVFAYATESETVAGTTVSDEYGVYALVLPGAKSYRIAAKSPDGKLLVSLEKDVTLGTSSGDEKLRADSEAKVGNRWGNDILLEEPTVEVEGTKYVSLNAALTAAREIVKLDPGKTPTVKILADTELRQSVTIDFACVVKTDAAVATPCCVTRLADAALAVTDAGSLALANVTFDGSEATLVTVAAGGSLKVGAGVDFGVPTEKVAVETADATGFELTGELTCGFMLSCAAAKDTGVAFGSYSCSQTVASGCVSKIVNSYDEYGEVRGAVEADGSLVWQVVQVPLSEAAGYFVTTGNKTNTYARLDRTLENFEIAAQEGRLPAKAEIVVLKSGSISRPLTLGGNVTLRGAEGVVISDLGSAAGFTVTNGTLTVSNLIFDGYTGNALFLVNGGALKLSTCELYNLSGTNYHSGAVAVRKGSAETSDGTVFGNCRATGQCSVTRAVTANGGAIYVGGADCALRLEDTVITNGWANGKGGGVYAVKDSSVSIGGVTKICDNTSGMSTKAVADNCYLANAEIVLKIVSPLRGGDAKIGVRSTGTGNSVGHVFASIDYALPTDPAARTAEYRQNGASFFNDYDATLEVADPDDGAQARLAWSEVAPEDHADPTDATCYLTQGAADGYYRRVSDAFAAVQDGSMIELLADDTFASDLVVSNRVVLLTAPGKTAFSLSRTAACSVSIVSGGQLTVTNAWINGYAGETTAEYAVPLVAVNGGALVLAENARVRRALGNGRRDANAVTVWNRGTITMLSGSRIESSRNAYKGSATSYGDGGGLLIEDHCVAYLRGGSIVDCAAENGNGALIASSSEAYVSGDFAIGSNGSAWQYAQTCLLTISDNSKLYLAAALSGTVRVCEGVQASTSQFGRVSWDTDDLEAINRSAAAFLQRETDVCGTLVTNATDRLLVWKSALDKDGNYTDSLGRTFHAPFASPVTPVTPGDPVDFSVSFNVGSDGKLHIVCDPVTEGCWYSVWQTSSLSVPFAQSGAARQLKSGEEFVLEFDKNASSGFYKVIAEPTVK